MVWSVLGLLVYRWGSADCAYVQQHHQLLLVVYINKYHQTSVKQMSDYNYMHCTKQLLSASAFYHCAV